MDNIKLKDYGEIISVEEYLLDKENKVIADFKYKGKNVNTKYTKGKILISSTLVREDETENYYVDISHDSNNSDKIANISFTAKRILPLYGYINIIENIISNKNKGITLPAKTYTYESSNNKDENSFDVNISCNNTDITLSFTRGYTVLVDGRNVICYKKEGKIKNLCIVGNRSYKTINNDENGLIDDITYVDFSCSNNGEVCKLSNFKPNAFSPLGIINNFILIPSDLSKNSIDIHFEYDEYGLLKKSSRENVLFEECYLEDESTLDYKMSLHPLYYDDFNTELIYGNNFYCLDQFVNESDKYYKFTRQICRIDEDKLDYLNTLLGESEHSDHPVIEFIDIDD